MQINENNFSDNNLALKKAVRYGVLTLLVLLLGIIPISFLISGIRGFYAGIIGVLIGAIFILATDFLVIFCGKLKLDLIMVVLLGGTFIKIIIVFLALLVLTRYSFYDHKLLGVSIILSWLLVFSVEIFAIFTTKQPYLDS